LASGRVWPCAFPFISFPTLISPAKKLGCVLYAKRDYMAKSLLDIYSHTSASRMTTTCHDLDFIENQNTKRTWKSPVLVETYVFMNVAFVREE
jgi:hypothetical protein